MKIKFYKNKLKFKKKNLEIKKKITNKIFMTWRLIYENLRNKLFFINKKRVNQNLKSVV